ncbi:putative transcription factor FAR family [Helianthus annuus]|nr:putative transcription factor FAR family [Helianthus annuus]
MPTTQATDIEHATESEDECFSCFTPNGTRYWCPAALDNLKPRIDTVFQQWEDVAEMYDLYAEHCGFSTRLGTIKRKKGAITHRYIVCSNHGKPHSQNRNFNSLDETSLKIGQATFRVCDCKACIHVKFDKSCHVWVLYHFEENHNHPMVPVHSRDLTKKCRRLDFFTKEFIHRASLSKVGPSLAHRLQVNLRGGTIT